MFKHYGFPLLLLCMFNTNTQLNAASKINNGENCPSNQIETVATRHNLAKRVKYISASNGTGRLKNAQHLPCTDVCPQHKAVVAVEDREDKKAFWPLGSPVLTAGLLIQIIMQYDVIAAQQL
jgi:hypothetical protein